MDGLFFTERGIPTDFTVLSIIVLGILILLFGRNRETQALEPNERRRLPWWESFMAGMKTAWYGTRDGKDKGPSDKSHLVWSPRGDQPPPKKTTLGENLGGERGAKKSDIDFPENYWLVPKNLPTLDRAFDGFAKENPDAASRIVYAVLKESNWQEAEKELKWFGSWLRANVDRGSEMADGLPFEQEIFASLSSVLDGESKTSAMESPPAAGEPVVAEAKSLKEAWTAFDAINPQAARSIMAQLAKHPDERKVSGCKAALTQLRLFLGELGHSGLPEGDDELLTMVGKSSTT